MNALETINDLDILVRECRLKANSLGLMISWHIKKRTGTVFLKYNHHIMWQASYTDKLPHIIVIMMYCGLYTEICKREKVNLEAAEKMRQVEHERLKHLSPFDNGRYRRKS